jgi:SagB-type dehydrogenase family enzyme
MPCSQGLFGCKDVRIQIDFKVKSSKTWVAILARYITSPAVRILRLHRRTAQYPFAIEDVLNKKLFQVDLLGAAITTAFAGGANVDDTCSWIQTRLGCTVEAVSAHQRFLLDQEIIVEQLDDRHRQFQKDASEWGAGGWSDAIFHHYATWDYPFIDYTTPAGFREDVRRMNQFFVEEPDPNWYKDYPGAASRIDCGYPHTFGELGSLCDFVESSKEPIALSGDLIKRVCSIVFSPMYAWDYSPGKNQPLILKACPSGGARHPSEVYLACKHVEGIPDGFHHFCPHGAQLEFLGHVEDEIYPFFSSLPEEHVLGPFAVFIVTSLFERNMFRYREPRTFRSVHLDAGHIVGALRSLGQAAGLRVVVRFDVNDSLVEGFTGSTRLAEGPMGLVRFENRG